MNARLPIRVTVILAVAALSATVAPATGAQDPPAGGGTDINAQVPSLLALSLTSAGPTTTIARVTATIPAVQLLASASAPGLSVSTAGTSPQPVRLGAEVLLSHFDHAVTQSRVVVRTRISPAAERHGTTLVITAAPQTP